MATKRKTNQKADLNVKITGNGHEALKIAKEQERNKRYVAVRINPKTTILVEEGKYERMKAKQTKITENNSL